MNMFLGLSAAAALMFSKSFFQSEKLDRFEFSVLVLYCTLGMSIMVSANTLLALYIGIENLRLHRLARICAYRRSHYNQWRNAWHHRRYDLLALRPCFQNFRRTVPYVDAGRL